MNEDRQSGGLRSFIGRPFSNLPIQDRPKRLLRMDGGDVLRVHTIKRGGMGLVYLCSSEDAEETEPQFALKTFDDRYFFHPGMQQAVEVEARTWMRLSGLPFILPLMGITSCDKKPHLVMPAVLPNNEGNVTLADEIRRHPKGMPSPRSFTVALAIALGLRGCGERIPNLVHGDIKPDNILLIGGDSPFLADFGTARIASRAKRPASVTGTAAYLAPECWEEEDRTTPASDVYALGATLYEMLAGAPPFASFQNDLQALKKAHRQEPARFSLPTENPLEEALQALALHCLQKDPTHRPPTAGDMLLELAWIGDQFARGEMVETLMAASQYGSATEGEAEIVTMRVEALLRQDDAEGALAIIETLPETDLTGRLLQLRGSALSLAGHDDDAIAVFERCLAEQQHPADRAVCQSELGLSLKRLGRLDEAKRLYEQAIQSAPPENLLALRANYATTLQEMGDLKKAEEILIRLTREHPKSSEVWGMLSDVNVKMEKPAEAADAIAHAIRLEPRNGRYRVMLGSIQIKGLHEVEAALETLNVANGLGYHVAEWLVLTLACNLLLGRAGDVGGLLDSVRNDLSEEVAMAMVGKALRIAKQVMDGGTSLNDIDESEDATAATDVATPEYLPSPPFPGLTSEPTEKEPEGTQEKLRAQIRAGTRPHLQMRMSAVDNTMIQDFYFGPEQPDYVEMFVQMMREVRNPIFSGLGNMRQRTTRHAFAKCPNCGAVMLTQRDEGERYRCIGCDEHVHVQRYATPELDALRGAALEAAYLKPKSLGGGTLFVGVGLLKPDQAEGVNRHFTDAGYAMVCPPRRIIHDMFVMQALDRAIDLPKEFEVWWSELPLDDAGTAQDGTQESFDRLLRETIREVGALTTMSVTIDSGTGRAFALATREEAFDQHLDGAEGVLESADHGRALVQAAIHLDRLTDAQRCVDQLRLLFPNDPDTQAAQGFLAMAEGNHALAIERIKAVLELRPRDQAARATLMNAYQILGKDDRARELWNKLQAHGMIPRRRAYM